MGNHSLKKINSFLPAILCLLLVLAVISGYYFFAKSKEFYGEMLQHKRAYEKTLHQKDKLINYEKMSYYIRTNSELISELDLALEDGISSLSMRDMSSDTVIMFFYSKLNCNSCLESVLGSIELENTVHTNFYLISDYDVKRDLYSFKRRSRIKQEVFKNKTKTFSNIYETFPFFVIQTRTDLFIFFPDKDFSERTLEFLSHWDLVNA